MQHVNNYWRQLDHDAIEKGEHRTFIGGMWDEIGQLQFDFLRTRGLQAGHKLLDVGCGSLRGGVHFVPFLDPGNYYGLDLNASLIDAGKAELEKIGCRDRGAHLLVDENFDFSRFDTQFDFALALSVFTHLYSNHIARCLAQMRRVLKPGGMFFATFFEAPAPVHLAPLQHQPGNITTHFDQDPFHYAFDDMATLARQTGLEAELIGAWNHPRAQHMLCFRRVSR